MLERNYLGQVQILKSKFYKGNQMSNPNNQNNKLLYT